MDLNVSTLFKLLLPLSPLIIKTLVFNLLSLSKNSAKQSAKLEVVVTIIRPIWIAKASLPPPPELDARDALLAAIKELGNGSETFTLPEYAPITGEWTGWRRDVPKTEPRPSVPDAEQYSSLMKEVTSPVTILYFHGGAFFLMDPASHRKTTSHLAKLTSGRVFSLRYRLAPQHPFPSALLDALLSYLYLLSPPPGSLHTPVPASSIVFAGDSAGGNLAISLNILILTLNRLGITSLPYHGTSVPLSPPAGVATNSPWLDLTNSLPSITKNACYDYVFAPTPQSPDIYPSTNLPQDNLWPTSPPRSDIYCSATLLTHPLVSPITLPPHLWSSSPPIFICTGEEALTDGCTQTTSSISRCQTSRSVIFAGYEGMPHCFALIFPTSPAGRDCFRRWSQFCIDAVVAGKVKRLETGLWMKARSNPPQFNEVPLEKITGISDEGVRECMGEMVARAIKFEEEAARKWEAKQQKAKL